MGIQALAFAATAYGVSEQRKAAKAQEEAQDIQQKQADAEAFRARMKVLREARIKRAMVLNSAAQTGTQGSSSESGAVSSIGSQAGSEIGGISSVQSMSRGLSALNKQTAGYQENAAISSAVAGFATSAGSMYGGFKTKDNDVTWGGSTTGTVRKNTP